MTTTLSFGTSNSQKSFEMPKRICSCNIITRDRRTKEDELVETSDISRLSQKDLDEILGLYQAAVTLSEIQRRFGLTARALRLVIRQFNLSKRDLPRTKRKKRHFTVAEVDGITRSYAVARSIIEIQEQFNISLSQLYRCLEERGISRRRGGKEAVAQSSNEAVAGIDPKDANSIRPVPRKRVELEGPLGPQIRERLAEMYVDRSLSVADIARQLEISPSTMTRLIRELKLPKRGKGGGLRATPAEIENRMPSYLRRHQAGESIRVLADEAGVGYSTLQQKLRTLRQQKQ